MITLYKNRHHWYVQKSNYHGETEAKIKDGFCCVIAHLIKKSANYESKEDVHDDSNPKVALKNTKLLNVTFG